VRAVAGNFNEFAFAKNVHKNLAQTSS